MGMESKEELIKIALAAGESDILLHRLRELLILSTVGLKEEAFILLGEIIMPRHLKEKEASLRLRMEQMLSLTLLLNQVGRKFEI